MAPWAVQSGVKLFLGILGNLTALGLFLAPVPTCVRVVRKRSTEDFSHLPYVCTFLNCALWTFYGLPFVTKGAILVLTINAVGLVLEASYLTVFLVFAARPFKLRILLHSAAALAFLAAVAVVTMAALHGRHGRSRLVGIISDVFAILMYASPLGIMRLVVATRSVEFMPFFLSLNAFLNGVAWTVYAVYVYDLYIGIPNGVGMILGAAQLILYAYYYKKTPQQGGGCTAPAGKDREEPAAPSKIADEDILLTAVALQRQPPDLHNPQKQGGAAAAAGPAAPGRGNAGAAPPPDQLDNVV